MKKYILEKIEELKNLYPQGKINIVNGFLGIENGERLKHTSYLGEAYFMIENIIYTDWNTKNNKAKKLITL